MRNSIKRSLIWGVLLTWFGVISSAQAVNLGTEALGTIGPGETEFRVETINGANTSFEGTYTFNFSPSVITGGVGGINNAISIVGFGDILNFSALSATLTKPDDSFNIFNILDLGDEFSTTFSAITGSYSLFVVGETSGIGGGSYSVAVSAVPVPAAVILFGTGLIGLIGVARRKPAARFVSA